MEREPKSAPMDYQGEWEVPEMGMLEVRKKENKLLPAVKVDGKMLKVTVIKHCEQVFEVYIGDDYSYLVVDFAGLSCEEQTRIVQRYSCETLNDKLSEMTLRCQCQQICDRCDDDSDSD